MTINESVPEFPTIVSDTAGLPCRVRAKGAALFGGATVYLCGLVIGSLICVLPLREHGAGVPWFVAGGLLILFVCAYGIWLLTKPYLILYPDRLEARGFLGWRTLRRSEIQGFRPLGTDALGSLFALVPRTPVVRPILLRETVRESSPGREWFAGLRDLKAKALEADKSSILADSRYGSDPTKRAARLEQAKGAAVFLAVAGAGVAVWILISPEQYQAHLAAVVGSLLVGLLFVQLSNGLIVWKLGGVRPSALGAVIPIGAVAYQAGSVGVLNAGIILGAAATAGVLLALVLGIRGTLNGGLRVLPAIAFCTALGVYGLAVLINSALAPAQSKIFPLVVGGKDIHRTSKTTTYNLRVAAWSDQAAGDLEVTSSLYKAVEIGSPVCVFRRLGALGLDWYQVKICPSGVQPPASALRALPLDFALQGFILAGEEGAAVVHCDVVGGARLSSCHAVAEIPGGKGVGAAAVKSVVDPRTIFVASQMKGRSTADILVTLKLWKPPAPKPPPNYPEAAWRAGKSGKAVVKCDVVDGAHLKNCTVVSETPPGLGFGAMAVDELRDGRIHVKPEYLAGRSVIVPVRFTLSD
jgi:MFS family permease